MEVIDKFLFHCKFEKHLSPKTLKAYAIDLAQFKSFMYGRQGLSDIMQTGKEELKQYIQFISEFKPKTIKRKIATTKAMFNFMEFDELIEINPFRKVRISIKEPKVLPRVMTLQEASLLFTTVYKELHEFVNKKDSYTYKEKVRDVAVIELLFGTGVRVSELCSLRYEDIGTDFSAIRVNGKGNKERTIQISNEAIKKALDQYYRLFSEAIGKRQFFFINRLGSRLSEQSVRLMIRKYKEKCNLTKKITPHVFRHSFATLLLEQDVDIKYIQNLLGHSSIMTTQIYTHVSTEKQSEILQNKHPRNGLILAGGKE
jgi:integrase/recombinase XerD